MLQSFRQIAAVVIETKYNAQKGGWVLRLVRGLKGNQSRADILVLMPHAWALHREEPNEHVADGKIAPMPKALDFPTDENVEEQAAARLAKAQAAQAVPLQLEVRAWAWPRVGGELLVNKHVKKSSDGDEDHRNKDEVGQAFLLTIGYTFHIYSP
jgi:hypothetical protein